MNVLIKNIISLILIVIPALSVAQSNHSQLLKILNAEESYKIEDYGTFYFDEKAILSPQQVHQLYQENKFNQLTEANSNFTHSIGTVWIALEIENQTGLQLYLNFRGFFLNHITVYSFSGEEVQSSLPAGSLLAFSTKEFKTSGYTLSIPQSSLSSKQLIFCAVKMDKTAPTFVKGKIGSLRAILDNNRFHELITIAIMGILIVMLFYNACLYIVTQDNLYFHYCCYLVSSIVVVAWFNGLLFEWFWPDFPSFNKHPWPMATYFVTQLFFINQILHVKDHLPRVYKLSLIFIGCSIATLILSFINISLSSGLIFSLAIIVPFYFLFTILSAVRRKEAIAFILILGWGPMLTVTVLNSIMTIGIINYKEAFDLHGVEVCLAWEVVIFSLALGYRYNKIKQQVIAVQNENLNIVENQKTMLEKMVTERTEEIVAQNEVLIRNQDQIQIQNERLESQNRAYEKLRELVLKQNQNLESAVNKRTIELANANQELKNNLKKIERFNFIAAHNLRGPVARILGLCMLVEKEESIKDSVNFQIIEKLKYSTKELDEIIHDLILILDIQSQTDKNYKKINPEELILSVLQQFRNELTKDEFTIDLSATIESITVIPEYFESIFINLISNSQKYKSHSGENRITIKIDSSENNTIIEYSDKGIGFESALYEDKIFEPFQKFHANSDGKGLGLFLIKSQISAMGGKIKLWSKPNMGLHITISLPDLEKKQRKNSNLSIKPGIHLN